MKNFEAWTAREEINSKKLGQEKVRAGMLVLTTVRPQLITTIL